MNLEELMDRDNFLADLKAGGIGAFTDYIIKNPECYEKMLGYLVQSYDNLGDQYNENTHKKYPYIVSEIFTIENCRLLEFLFIRNKLESQTSLGVCSQERLTTIEDDFNHEEEQTQVEQEQEREDEVQGELFISGTSIQYIPSHKSKQGLIVSEPVRIHMLQILFSILEREDICDTAAGYYTKVLQQIVRKNGPEVWDHVMNYTNILGDLLKHINHPQFVDIIVRLIILDQMIPNSTQQIIVNYRCYKERKQIMEILTHQMDDQKDNKETVANLCKIILQVLKMGVDNQLYQYLRELYDIILKPQYFFDIAKKTDILPAYQLVPEVAQFICANQLKDQKTAQFIRIISSLPAILLQNIQQDTIISTYGKSCTFFGQKNLSIIRLLSIIIKYQNPFIIDAIFQSDLINILFKYMVDYQWNNQLLNYIQIIITTLIGQDKLNCRLFSETQLINILYSYQVESKHNQLGFSKRLVKYGFMGILNQISRALLKEMHKSKLVRKQLEEYIHFDKLLEAIHYNLQVEDTYLCNVDPKTHLDEAPPEISIDRQMELILDSPDNKSVDKTEQESPS